MEVVLTVCSTCVKERQQKVEEWRREGGASSTHLFHFLKHRLPYTHNIKGTERCFCFIITLPVNEGGIFFHPTAGNIKLSGRKLADIWSNTATARPGCALALCWFMGEMLLQPPFKACV